MRFTAFDAGGTVIATQVYFRWRRIYFARGRECWRKVVKPFLLFRARMNYAIGDERGLAIWEIALENEKAWHTEAEIRGHVALIWG